MGIARAFPWGMGGRLGGSSIRGGLSSDEGAQADVEHDTAYFSGDLMDPQNPGHDAWVARQKERFDADALVDPTNPGHRDAVQSISHVSDATHESILQRIKDELAKH